MSETPRRPSSTGDQIGDFFRCRQSSGLRPRHAAVPESQQKHSLVRGVAQLVGGDVAHFAGRPCPFGLEPFFGHDHEHERC